MKKLVILSVMITIVAFSATEAQTNYFIETSIDPAIAMGTTQVPGYSALDLTIRSGVILNEKVSIYGKYETFPVLNFQKYSIHGEHKLFGIWNDKVTTQIGAGYGFIFKNKDKWVHSYAVNGKINFKLTKNLSTFFEAIIDGRPELANDAFSYAWLKGKDLQCVHSNHIGLTWKF